MPSPPSPSSGTHLTSGKGTIPGCHNLGGSCQYWWAKARGAAYPTSVAQSNPPSIIVPPQVSTWAKLWETLVKVTANGSLLHDNHTDRRGENSRASGGAQKWDLGALRNIICTSQPPEPPRLPFLLRSANLFCCPPSLCVSVNTQLNVPFPHFPNLRVLNSSG